MIHGTPQSVKRFLALGDGEVDPMLQRMRIVRTQCHRKERLNPVWDETFEIEVNDPEREVLSVRVKSQRLMSTSVVGACVVALYDLHPDGKDEWVQLTSGKKEAGRIRLQLRLWGDNGQSEKLDSRMYARDCVPFRSVAFTPGSIRRAARKDSVRGAAHVLQDPRYAMSVASDTTEETDRDSAPAALPSGGSNGNDQAVSDVLPVRRTQSDYPYLENANDSITAMPSSRVAMGSKLHTLVGDSSPYRSTSESTISAEESWRGSSACPDVVDVVEETDKPHTRLSVAGEKQMKTHEIVVADKESEECSTANDRGMYEERRSHTPHHESEECMESVGSVTTLLANLTEFEGNGHEKEMLDARPALNPSVCQLLERESRNVLIEEDEDDEDDIVHSPHAMTDIPILEELRSTVQDIDCMEYPAPITPPIVVDCNST